MNNKIGKFPKQILSLMLAFAMFFGFVSPTLAMDILDNSMLDLDSQVYTYDNVNVSDVVEIIPHNMTLVNNLAELRAAVTASAGTAFTPTDPSIITVTQSFNITSPAINIPANANFRLVTNNPNGITLTTTGNWRHFSFTTNASAQPRTFELGVANNSVASNITLAHHFHQPGVVNTQNDGGGIGVGTGDAGNTTNTTFIMHDGVTITGTRRANHGPTIGFGAGVTFIMEGGLLTGNTANTDNGVVGDGGAVYMVGGSTFIMNGGHIINNHRLSGGGNVTGGGGVAIHNANTTFIMNGGIIEENWALTGSGAGAGVLIGLGATFTMNDGYIRNHIAGASGRGGGVAVNGIFNMNGGVIDNNVAAANGGGVWVATTGQFNMTAGTISNNRVTNTNANGGGVFTASTNFSNLNIGNVGGLDTSDQIHFYGNTSGAYGGSPLMINMGVLMGLTTFQNIRWDNWQNAHEIATTSLPDMPVHLLNNWDVNLSSLTPYTILRVLTMVNGGDNAFMSGTNPAMETTGSQLFFIPIAGETVTIDAGTRVGYTFSHWTTSPNIVNVNNNTNARIENIGNLPNQNVTVTAHWVSSNTVTFDANNGVLGAVPNYIQVQHGSTADGIYPSDAFPTAQPTRQHYTFIGWNTAADGSGLGVTAETVILENITAYAQWIPIMLTVTFDANSGVLNQVPISIQVQEGSTANAVAPNDPFPTVEPSRTFYIFTGWNTAPDGSGIDVTAETVISENITVYAQWIPNMLTVAFNANGGSLNDVPASIQVQEGSTANGIVPNSPFPTVEPSRTFYIFTGWNTAPDGSGIDATAETVISENITVYAQWVPNMLTIIFDPNDGALDDVPTSIEVQEGSTANGITPNDPFPTNIPSRASNIFISWIEDFIFTSWNTAPDGSGTEVTDEMIITENITVFAQWTSSPRCILHEWDPFETYNIGDLVIYDGRIFKARNTWRGHGDLNWRPTLTPNLWLPTSHELHVSCQPIIFADEWDAHTFYTARDYVTFNGRVYRALLTHQGFGDLNWNPALAPSLWELTDIDISRVLPLSERPAPVVPDWDPFGIYSPGDRVYFNGRIFEALVPIHGHGDTNWNPAVLQALWRWISD